MGSLRNKRNRNPKKRECTDIPVHSLTWTMCLDVVRFPQEKHHWKLIHHPLSFFLAESG